MCEAIKADISSFNKDVKLYIEGSSNSKQPPDLAHGSSQNSASKEYSRFKYFDVLRGIKIHDALVRNGKTTLADYFSEEELEQSRENLEARKHLLKIRMEKLLQNNDTLKSIVDGISSNRRPAESAVLRKFLFISQKLGEIGKATGLDIFDRKSELLGEKDYSWSKADEKDRVLYERLSGVVIEANKALDAVSSEAKVMYETYIVR